MIRKINLKKQLAFISSLALIAGTAVYMPANVGEILGISQSVSAVDNEITVSDYNFSYRTNHLSDAEYNSTDNSGYFEMQAKDDTSVDAVLYVPDDLKVMSDETITLNADFSYNGKDFKIENESIKVGTYFNSEGKFSTTINAANSDSETVTVNLTVQLVPTWKSLDGDDISFKDGDSEYSDYKRITYEEAERTDDDNDIIVMYWLRVYTIKDCFNNDEIEILTDGIYSGNENNSKIIVHDKDSAVYLSISEDKKISASGKLVNSKLPNMYINKGTNEISTTYDENTIKYNKTIVENYSREFKDTQNDEVFYITDRRNVSIDDENIYLYKVTVSAKDNTYHIERIARKTNSYIKLVSEPDVSVTFNANGGTFENNETVKTVDIPESKEVLIKNYITKPSRVGYNFKEWNTAYDGMGDSYTIDTKNTFSQNKTLYAQWTPIKYKILPQNPDGYWSTNYPIYCKYDDEPIKYNCSEYKKEDYVFLGFSRKENAESPDAGLEVDSEGYVTFPKNLTTTDGETIKFYSVYAYANNPLVRIDGKIYRTSDKGLENPDAENSPSNPTILEVKLNNKDYGTVSDYKILPADGAVTIKGSAGTVTFDSEDGSAETDIYKSYVNGVEKYYKIKFIQNTVAENLNIEFDNFKIKTSYEFNNGEEIDNSVNFECDNNFEVIDGHYAKNYTGYIYAKAKPNQTYHFSFDDVLAEGYRIEEADNKFDITLDENGKASKIIKVYSTWESKDNIEYIKLNFKLLDNYSALINGEKFNMREQYYITDGDRYAIVYTVRDKIPEDRKAEVHFLWVYLGDQNQVHVYDKPFMDSDGNYTEWIDVNEDGSTDIHEIYDNCYQVTNYGEPVMTKKSVATSYYIKVVFNPVYTHSFCEDADGKTVLFTQEETVGEKYTVPSEIPEKEGYKFAGWYIDENTQLYAGMTVEKAHGTKAYAKWNPINYTVKLDANGGTAATSDLGDWSISNYGTSVQQGSIAYDTTDKTISQGTNLVKRDGYDLLGFSTDKNAAVPDENLSFLDEDGNILDGKEITLDKLATKDGSTVNLYAVWRAESGEITLDPSRILNDVSYLKSSVIVLENNKIKYTIGSKVGELPVPELKGHTFEGWYYKINPTDKWTKITADMIFTKELVQAMKTAGGIVTKFTENEYTINYDDCGTENNTSAVKFVFDAFSGKPRVLDSDGKYKDDYESLAENPEKEGYTFVGYTIDGIVKNDFAETKEYFTPDDIKNFFAGNELTYNTSAAKSEKFAIGAEDVTIKAVWKVDETKSIINVNYDNAVISYKNAKGKTITVKPTSSSYEKFPSAILGTPEERISAKCEIDGDDGLDNITFTDYGFDIDDIECTLSKDGYVFKGWYTKDSDGKEIAFKSTKFIAGVTDIYAKWEVESNLTAPANIKVDANGTVTWTGGEGAAYFRVYKVYNGITKNAKTTSSPYTFQSLASGVEHEIYVVAYDGNRNSLKSESIRFTPVSAPENVAVSEDGVVTWTGGEGAAYFRVYKVYNGITKNAKTESSPYTFQNLTEGVEHEIYVVAFDAQGNQYKSESVKFTPAKKAVLTVPTNVKVDADGNVTWTAAENAAYYKVSKIVGGKTYTGKQVTDTKYTFISFNPGQNKTVYVTAFDKDGNSLKSEAITVKAVENIKVTATGVVTFDKVDGASYYRVYKVYNGTTKNAKTTTSPYTFQTFTKGVKHDVYVKAFDAAGKEIAVSKTVTVTAK